MKALKIIKEVYKRKEETRKRVSNKILDIFVEEGIAEEEVIDIIDAFKLEFLSIMAEKNAEKNGKV